MLIIYGLVSKDAWEAAVFLFGFFSSYFENCRVFINSTFFNMDLLAYLTLKVTKIGFRYSNVTMLNALI